MSNLSLAFLDGRWPVRGGELIDARRLNDNERKRAENATDRLSMHAVAQEFLFGSAARQPARGHLGEIARYLRLPQSLAPDAHSVVREIEKAIRGGKVVLLCRPCPVVQHGKSPTTLGGQKRLAPPPRPQEETFGTFVLQYEVKHLAAWYDTTLTLSADDGSFSAEWHLTPNEDGSDPPARFVFTGLPLAATFSLCLQEADVDERWLFEGVRYDELGSTESPDAAMTTQ